jgi:hypothetical protein
MNSYTHAETAIFKPDVGVVDRLSEKSILVIPVGGPVVEIVLESANIA